MKQTVLTFIAKVDAAKVPQLEELLDQMAKAKNVEYNDVIPFAKLQLLHFASLVLVTDRKDDAPVDDKKPKFGACFVFENNFDGPLGPYLEELYAQAAAGLHRLYSFCADYRVASAADKTQMLAYLRAHVVKPNAYHIGNVGRSLVRTRREDKLRNACEDFLDGVVKESKAESPASIRKRTQEFVRGEGSFQWAATAELRQTWFEWFWPRLHIGILVIIGVPLLPLLIPLVIIWVIMLRWTETHEPPPAELDVKKHVQKLVEREDRTHVVQNHLANITVVKPGLFRRVTLPIVLWLVNLGARTADKGQLSGIPSIHFAHWSVIDNGRRLLFLSNFDGSWENYLDDFIDKASNGLTAVWTNTVDFPRANWLIKNGARDGSRFKAQARDKQTFTNVWYSAYKQLTVQTIDNNSSIREDLFTSLDDPATREWLRRF